MTVYKPLKIIRFDVYGLNWALNSVRMPFDKSIGDSDFDMDIQGTKDLALLSGLQATGDDHGKANRSVDVWVKFQFQAGWMIELETYRHGIDTLSTTSSMHNELKSLFGHDLAEQKQLDLPTKVYTRNSKISYQTLRAMYLARRNHKHPCWQIWCDWIETLPYAKLLITQKTKSQIKIEKLEAGNKELIKNNKELIKDNKELIKRINRLESKIKVLEDDIENLEDELLEHTR